MTSVGTFSVPLEIGDPRGERWERVEALVDTGATYTSLPRDLLERFGVQVSERQAFQIADNRRIELSIGTTLCRLDGRERPIVVVFADSAAQPLLGAHTLETFSLAPDPVGKRLVRVDALLMEFVARRR